MGDVGRGELRLGLVEPFVRLFVSSASGLYLFEEVVDVVGGFLASCWLKVTIRLRVDEPCWPIGIHSSSFGRGVAERSKECWTPFEFEIQMYFALEGSRDSLKGPLLELVMRFRCLAASTCEEIRRGPA